MKECFVPKKFRGSSLEIVEHANRIIEEYREEGFVLTVRQLYYQFVSGVLIPNNAKSYNRLKNIVSEARLAGLIDWDAIEDRTRFLRKRPTWKTLSNIIRSCSEQFCVDPWVDQDVRVEVLIEKDALIGVIEDVCNEHFVGFMSARGYMSSSEVYSLVNRIRDAAGLYFDKEKGWGRNYNIDVPKRTVIIHLGDHDPSGIDMTRDFEDRFEMMGVAEWVDVKRIALNMTEVEKLNLPPNPAKETDSRWLLYQEKFGHESWELDAIRPNILSSMVARAIQAEITDETSFNERLQETKLGRQKLLQLAEQLMNTDTPLCNFNDLRDKPGGL